MCSIIGSFNKEKVKELVKLNQHRGNFSYSISVYNVCENKIIYSYKDFGEFNVNKFNSILHTPNNYYICHIQAPTGGMLKDYNRIHPVKYNNTYLWHNGILKLKDRTLFDTKYLTNILSKKGFNGLSDIEGLFSCVYYNKGLYMFRTKHGKLYIDKDMNVSSEKFENSKCINFDTVYKVNLKNKEVIIVNEFKTKKFNIVIKGEL